LRMTAAPWVAMYDAGLPDGIFRTKKPNLGIFWSALEWKMLVYVFYGHFSNFGRFYQE
jgi:hypothetical protein